MRSTVCVDDLTSRRSFLTDSVVVSGIENPEKQTKLSLSIALFLCVFVVKSLVAQFLDSSAFDV